MNKNEFPIAGSLHHGADVNKIMFDRDDFDSADDFWEQVSTAARLLTKLGYAVLFRYEDTGIYVMEYETVQGWADNVFFWVPEDKAEEVENFIEESES